MQPTKSVKATGIHKIDSDTHYIITTNQGFRLHKIAGGAVVRNCEEIPSGLSLCQSYRNSQLFFVVGTGEDDWPTTTLFVWDN